MAKKRVAILGGGCGSMAAAYYLSNERHLREHLDVTVYQIGWRLGGKGANGRNSAYFDRVEEHGLHVWGGFYYNAFRMVREAYDALNRPPDCPMRRWDDAFNRFPQVAWQELIDDEWITWPITTPLTDELPGEGPQDPSPFAHLQMLAGWVKTAILDWPNDSFKAELLTPMEVVDPDLVIAVEAAKRGGVGALYDGTPYSLLVAAHALAVLIQVEGPMLSAVHRDALMLILQSFNAWLVRKVEKLGKLATLARRIFIVINLGLAMAVGMIVEGVPRCGYSVLDGYDLAEFLGTYGATKLSLTSAPLRGYYDYFFAYENGDPSMPRMSAGSGIRHLLRLVTEFKGALFYKMTAGMGDAAFAPLYEICVRNGVKFKFFHRLEQVVPASDGKSIGKVILGKQVDIIGDADYAPLVFPRNVPSWPSEPLYQQIPPAQVEELKRRQADLEDPWTDWDNVGTVELQAGKDFDAVVLGVSIGAFPLVCNEIMTVNSEWNAMVEHLPTVQTQALQLWWAPNTEDLGWTGGNVTGTANGQPMQSWSDMTQALPQETWPPELAPKSLIFFCGPQLNPPRIPPAGKHPEYGKEQTAKAWENVLAWTQTYLANTFPNAFDPSGMRWDLLVDPYNHSGIERFHAQYVKSNYQPSDRYVVDLPGTNQYRLEADTSGYTNLALAGDWLYTGLGGAVEAAVISGMQAARALARKISYPIVGETRSPWPRPVSVQPLLDLLQEFL